MNGPNNYSQEKDNAHAPYTKYMYVPSNLKNRLMPASYSRVYSHNCYELTLDTHPHLIDAHPLGLGGAEVLLVRHVIGKGFEK